MKLVITIDTEEDDWSGYNPTRWQVENIRQIPTLQRLLDRFGVVPTYLVTYPVATDEASIAILRDIAQTDRCEIGAHCHPWNTPPPSVSAAADSNMLFRLPADLQFRKIETLHQTITRNFGKHPTSFRSGRWGYGPDVARALAKLQYRVDTSVLSLIDWTSSGGPDYSGLPPTPYHFHPETPFHADPRGPLLQIPATVGFLQGDQQRSTAWDCRLRRAPWRPLRLIGLFDRLGWLNRVWLSPEQATGDEMIALTRSLLRTSLPVVNLFFHSGSLRPGCTPFVKTDADRADFLKRIETFLVFAKAAGIESIRLSDAVDAVPRC